MPPIKTCKDSNKKWTEEEKKYKCSKSYEKVQLYQYQMNTFKAILRNIFTYCDSKWNKGSIKMELLCYYIWKMIRVRSLVSDIDFNFSYKFVF